MSIRKKLSVTTTACVLSAAAFAVTAPVPAGASEAGAFIGGVAASRIMSNMRRRTQAEEIQAYNSSRAAQPVQQAAPAHAAPAASSSMTPEQRIQQLDKLAAGGYITPAEYKAKKKAILDSL
jgi:hypothetical protein